MIRTLVALSLLTVGAIASAQEQSGTDLAQSAVGFGFRLGAFLPADSRVRDVATTFIDFGIEYDFEKSVFKNGTTYIAGDWISPSLLGGQHLATFTVNQRFYTKNQRFAVGGSPYFYAGIGGEWLHAAGNSSDMTWVVRGGLGSEFQGDYFVELGGSFSPKVGGVNGSGASVSVGYRFKD